MSTQPNDGGPAFPRHTVNFRDKDMTPSITYGNEGMSLRAYFAGRALHGMLSNSTLKSAASNEMIAKYATEYADALIAELNKTQQ